jgi:CheY-like chemotaxis protein
MHPSDHMFADRAETAPGGGGATPWLPDLSGVHVLVIEDDESSRDILADVLRFAGARVSACPDAYAGLKTLEEFRPDVIVCDLALPGMDGLSFLYALRAHHDSDMRRTPMLAVTGYDEIYRPEEFLRLGCEGYMMKPLSLDRVCAAVQKLGRLTGERRCSGRSS